jgi:2-methylisocitrate lyase-like PEP mutase family enzyme
LWIVQKKQKLTMSKNLANLLREKVNNNDIFPFIGVYDVFSASVAAKYFEGIFISGFGFAASYYGLPDIGFICWSDILNFVQRVRTILPNHYLLVDIDDGYVDIEVASHVVALLETMGIAGVIMEDQKRPRRCGHMDGKQILDLDDYLRKLEKVLATRKDIFVVARTDVSDTEEVVRRAKAFANAGADAILADGIKNLETIRVLKEEVNLPLVFNQIAGGKSPACNLQQLHEVGVRLVNYSTPCLFAAQAAIEDEMAFLKENDGWLEKKQIGLLECNEHLIMNLASRYDAQETSK